MASPVATIVRLRGSRAFAQQATASAKAIGSIEAESDAASDKAKAGWKNVAKIAGGTAALYSAGRFLKSAVASTEDLAKATMTLQRATGLDAKTASAWAEITKVRGIDAKRFNVGLVKLSKLMEAARGGNAKAAATFDALGVDRAAIATGDVNTVLMASADAFSRMENPATKAATAQALFGKSGQALLPLLSSGSAGVREQLDMVERYGGTLGSTDDAKELIASQREMRFAMDGLKIQLGTKLLPAILAFSGVLLNVVRAASPVLRNSTAVYIVIGLLSAAFVASKVAAIQAAVAFVRSNLTLVLIALAVAALIAAGVWLATKRRWFFGLVTGTLAWIKANWQMLAVILLGPLGVAIVLLVRNVGRIRDTVKAAWSWISTTANRIGAFLSSVFSVDFLAGFGRGVADWLNVHTLFADTVDLKFAGSIRIPALAGGGYVRSAGAALVGEEGPEVVSFDVPAVQRIPNPRVPKVLRERYGTGRPHAIVQEVHLSRRELTEAAAAHAADVQARR